MRSLRAGDSEACAELVCGHYQGIYRFLLHLTRDIPRAEDLTQETFAAAWEGIATFQGRSSLATWLHRIAYTKFIGAQRSQRRASIMHERTASTALPVADPLETAAALDEARRLYEALDELDAADRTLLVLHYLQGLSYRDMAMVLQEPTGTVKWRTSEALDRLRTVLSDEVSDYAIR
ncbi:MAG TPA: RNA polymerase sigma factor [Isosphaeraceae bacterium]|nr:RNA polymerase sigma factor [Isosphaeraceae bacterium]